MKKLVQQKILYFQGFSATLFLHSRTISRHVLSEIADHVPLYADGCGGPGKSGRGSGINAGGVVDKVGGKCTILNLLVRQLAGQLMNDGSDHLQVAQFLCTHIGVKKYTNSKKP